MELIQKLKELDQNNNLTKEEILKFTNENELLFFFTEAIASKEPHYNNIHSLFSELRKNAFEEGDLNIFDEYLTIKLVYLREVYGVDQIIINALIAIFGPVHLDFILEQKFFQEDEFYNFLIKRYREYKADNELSILKMLNSLDFSSFGKDLEEMKGVFEEFKKYVPEDQLS